MSKITKSKDTAQPGSRGGPGAEGGFNFQQALTAIVMIAIATGQRLGWLMVDDTPVSVSCETNGAGDDIGLILCNAMKIEVQAKKGLRAGEKLWIAVMKLAKGIAAGEIAYGILAVCDASRTISVELARDIARLGEGREDGLSDLGKALRKRLKEADYPVRDVCSRLRIHTFHANEFDAADVRAACTRLERLLVQPNQAVTAFRLLHDDAGVLIERRGARDAATIAQVLRAHDIQLVGAGEMPSAILAAVAAWTLASTKDFKILGVAKPLPLDVSADLVAHVLEETEDTGESLQTALERYHNPREDSRRDVQSVDPLTLGRFRFLAVVIAGPGMGKTTFLKRLAREYAKDGLPVIRVSLRSVASRMRANGEAFTEAAFRVGLADSSIAEEPARRLVRDWVLLCDGLDECGTMQDNVAAGMAAYAAAHPGCRIIATTRPIGYRPGILSAWRHYEIPPLGDTSAFPMVVNLLDEILPANDPRRDDISDHVGEQLRGNWVKDLAARSPLLLSLIASLIARRVRLGRSKSSLYGAVIQLIQSEPPPRAPEARVGAPVLARFLEVLAWALTEDPLASAEEVTRACATAMAAELGAPVLAAREKAQACFDHWEALGVIERLHHEGRDALTFVHKTIGEYAAARYLSGREEVVRGATIRSRVNEAAFSEVLSFAAAEGLGDEVCLALLEARPGESNVDNAARAISLAAELEVSVSSAVLDALVGTGFSLLQSKSRPVGTKAAEALIKLGERYPAEVGAHARPLLLDERNWTRVGAWVCALRIGPEHYDFDEMKQLLAKMPEIAVEDSGRRLGGRFVLSLGTSVGDLIDAFSLLAIEQVLERGDKGDREAVLPIVQSLEKMRGNVRFLRQLTELLKKYGVEYLPESFRKMAEQGSLFWRSEEYLEAAADGTRRFLKPVALPEDAMGEDVPEYPRPPVELAAFLQMVGWDARPVSDTWAWAEVQDDAPVAALVKAAAAVSGLPLDKLTAQAQIMRRRADLMRKNKYGAWTYETPSVDTYDMEWDRARGLGLDPELLEPMLHHRTESGVKMAAHLIDGAFSRDIVLGMAERAVASGRDLTVAVGAALAKTISNEVAVDLMYARLSRPLTRGCEHLYYQLELVDPPFDERARAAIAAGLAGAPAYAVAAARYARHFAKAGQADLHDLLACVYEDWKTKEEPVESGKVVPQSPRALLLEAMFVLRPPPEVTTLLRHNGDARSDVNDVVRPRILQLAKSDPEAVTQLVDAILDGRWPKYEIRRLVQDNVSISSADVARLLALLESSSPFDRDAATALLTEPYVSTEVALDHARKLVEDEEQELREAGYRILRKHGQG